MFPFGSGVQLVSSKRVGHDTVEKRKLWCLTQNLRQHVPKTES